MATCLACTRDNSRDASFCQGCGLPLQTGCSQCGRSNTSDALFCNGCGTRLEGAAVASTISGKAAMPRASTSTLPTQFQGGRYLVKRFLGEGATKKVFTVRDTFLDRDVAFALIKFEGLDEADQQRVQREAQMLAKLGDHPNIVQIFDFGLEDEQTFMVLPLIAGGTMDTLVAKARDGSLELSALLQAAIGICNGLDYAHSRGIVHRDLKPKNVWLTSAGIPKIGDFGIAFSNGQTRLTLSGWLLGTVGYMAPEQAKGYPVDERSDLYSLGAVLYELATGSKPFNASNPMAVVNQHINAPPLPPSWHNAACPGRLEELILQLLAKEPTHRPESASSVVNHLLTMAALEGIGTVAS